MSSLARSRRPAAPTNGFAALTAAEPGLPAYLYYRVSSAEQTEGYSLDAQARACRQFAQERGWAIVGEWVEPGRSAHVEEIERRPQFSNLLATAAAAGRGVVVVHKLDRFSRNLRVTLETLDRLGKAGVTFVSISEQMDFTTPMGKVFLALVGAFAQYYSDNLSAEVKKGYRERKAQGLYGGLLPFGAMKGPDGVPVPDTRPLALPGGPSTAHAGLLLAFRECALGANDLTVARVLNERGYRPTTGQVHERRARVAALREQNLSAEAIGAELGVDPALIRADLAALANGHPGRHTPGLFTKDTTRSLLTNRFYIGLLPDGDGGWFEGRHAPLVDRDLWDRAQAARERNRTVQEGVRRGASVWALSGLARCDRCGGKMHVYMQRAGRRRVLCATRLKRRGCDQPTIFQDLLEEQIAEHLAGFTIPDDYGEQILAMHRALVATDDSAAQRRQIEGQLARLKKLYEWGDKTDQEYAAEKAALQAMLATLRPTSVAAEPNQLGRLRDLLASMPAAWGAADQAQRNRLAKTLYDEVWIRDKQVIAVKPRPEFAPFFELARQADVWDGRTRPDSNRRSRP